MSRYLVDKHEDHPEGEMLSGEEEAIFEGYLRERGLKYTRPRKELLHKIFEMHDHFTADQLLDRLRLEGVSASKATVYRTLSILIDCHLLIAHDFGEGALYYEHIYGHRHHDHLFCLHCKSIVEFIDEVGEAHQLRVTSDLGFRMVSRSLKIYGLCQACQALPGVPEKYRRGPVGPPPRPA